MANSWFIRTLPLDPCFPVSYVITTGTPSCSGSNQICAIFAHVNPGNTPDIDCILLCDMVQALDSRSSSLNVKLRA